MQFYEGWPVVFGEKPAAPAGEGAHDEVFLLAEVFLLEAALEETVDDGTPLLRGEPARML